MNIEKLCKRISFENDCHLVCDICELRQVGKTVMGVKGGAGVGTKARIEAKASSLTLHPLACHCV